MSLRRRSLPKIQQAATGLEDFDAFDKPMDAAILSTPRTRSISKVLLILISVCVAVELYFYWHPPTKMTFTVDQNVSLRRTLPIELSMLVYMNCRFLSIDIVDESDTLHHVEAAKESVTGGCKIDMKVHLPKLDATLHITPLKLLLDDAETQKAQLNLTHAIDYLRFGPVFPGQDNPLIRIQKQADLPFWHYRYHVHLVPTTYQSPCLSHRSVSYTHLTLPTTPYV